MLEKSLDSIVPESIALSSNQRGGLAYPTEAEEAREQLFLLSFSVCLFACFLAFMRCV